MNAYNDSLDLEWNFQSNMTGYVLFIQDLHTGSKTSVSTQNNEISIKNLSAGGEYDMVLFGSGEKSCQGSLKRGRMKKVDKLLSDEKLHQILPSKMIYFVGKSCFSELLQIVDRVSFW